ncbi:MAG: DUF1801 domain-containing protein [Myxococcota bacterium]
MSDRAPLTSEICAAIAEALPEATQREKWKAPSFALADRDLVTLNFPPRDDSVRVVFHRGTKAVDTKTGTRLLHDDTGRLEWATDQRAHARFTDLDSFRPARDWLIATCRAWAQAASDLD